MTTQTLLIMRHAKSDWSANEPDFDRPLNKRGLKDAEKMGTWLKQQKLVPDLIVSSPAHRAKQTIKIVCEQLGKDVAEIIWDKRIYEAALDNLLEVIAEHGKHAKCMLLTGHCPGLDYLVAYLSRDEPARNGENKLMTTAAIAVVEFEKGISNKENSGKIAKLARPREI